MKKRKLFSIMIALAVSAAVISCSDSESRMSPLLKKTAVTLNLGLPPENPSADNNSIWNRIRRFFVKDAVAQTAPAAFGSVLVRVAGADFGAMEQTFGGTDAISLSVPSGSLRQFEVIAYTAPGDPSAALSFRGTATADLPAGGTVSIPVVMGLNETKIVAPDGVNQFSPGTAGLVMIDNIDGSNWIHRTAASFAGFSGTLSPYDISFDTRGRIYIANNNTPGVIRMDNINGTNLIQSSASLFETGGAPTSTQTIAVDIINNLVYFANAGTLYRSSLDGTSTLTLTGHGLTSISGIDVDGDGMLYLVGSNTIVRYNPDSQTVVAGPYTSFLASPNDVIIKTPYIYIANLGSSTAQIIQLTINNDAFSLVAQYGTQVSSPDSSPSHFYGAYKFLAIRNDLIIADSNPNGTPTGLAKLISTNPNPLGSGWIAYGQHGPTTDTPDTFYLFSYC